VVVVVATVVKGIEDGVGEMGEGGDVDEGGEGGGSDEGGEGNEVVEGSEGEDGEDGDSDEAGGIGEGGVGGEGGKCCGSLDESRDRDTDDPGLWINTSPSSCGIVLAHLAMVAGLLLWEDASA
jgi:hypothetical protein